MPTAISKIRYNSWEGLTWWLGKTVVSAITTFSLGPAVNTK